MGKTKFLIDKLISEKAKGNTFQELNVQMKLLFKGIDCKKITDDMPDDPQVIKKIFEVAKDLNVSLPTNLN